MGWPSQTTVPLSTRDAVSCSAATLITYVGFVHEIVGATLYPEGPAELGGPIAWHALGLAGIAAGALLIAGALHFIRIPLKPLAALLGLMSATVFVAEAWRNGGFHFFAFTVVVASGVLILTQAADTLHPRAVGTASQAPGARARNADRHAVLMAL